MRNRRTLPDRNRAKRLATAAAGGGAALIAVTAVAGCGPIPGLLQGAHAPSSSPSLAAVAASAPAPSQSPAPQTTAPRTVTPQSVTPQTTAPQTPAPPATAQAPDPQTPATRPSAPAAKAPSSAAQGPAAASSPTAVPAAVIPVIGHTATGGRTVALTFDDGPGPYTPQVLDVLAQYGVKATFCEIGQQAAANPALVKRVVAEGHRLCDHTMDHPQPMHTLSYDRQATEIGAAKDALVKAAGPGTRISWYRAPGGDFGAVSSRIAVNDGMRPLGWTVDTRDWTRPGVPTILGNVQQELKPGGVILMHDGGGDRSQTVAALKQLIPSLLDQGYTFTFPAS